MKRSTIERAALAIALAAGLGAAFEGRRRSGWQLSSGIRRVHQIRDREVVDGGKSGEGSGQLT
jgi:hypothetical protein